jgi:protein SCO1/2
VEDRLIPTSRPTAALAALALILVITAVWWTLALWPPAAATPEWVTRTRLACFGAEPGGLPNAGGWLVMIGQPLGMLLVLVAAWRRDLRDGFGALAARVSGQIAIGAALGVVAGGIALVVVRVADADARPFAVNGGQAIAAQLTRVRDAAPTLRLADQTGRQVSLDEYRGRPVLVTFAYAHCQTVCPLVVADALAAQRELAPHPPELVIVTLDPWRDTPSRLPTIAEAWKLPANAHVLSGAVEEVERVLNAWRVPRVRNEATGDLTHPVVVYVIGADGRIAYVTNGGTNLIVAAVRAL